MEKKQLNISLNLENVAEDGSFAGYASVFDITDRHKDIIIRGAFDETISKHNKLISQGKPGIKLLWQHHADEPIGVITELHEDSHGLYVKGLVLTDVARGKEAYSLLKSGAMDGLSIGYNVIDSEMDHATGVRYLKIVDLWEISLVTFPANEAASVLAVKNRPETIREFETLLRDAGYTRAESKAIASYGYKSAENPRDAEDGWMRLEGSIAKAIDILNTPASACWPPQ